MNTTAPHPEPLYWVQLGRQMGQAGETSIDPDCYGRIFGEDNPPIEWLEAVAIGIRQGHYDWMQGRVPEFEEWAESAGATRIRDQKHTSPSPLMTRLIRWVQKIAR